MSLKCFYTLTIWILYFILSCMQMFNNWHSGERLYLVFAHVHGVSIPTMANCKLPKIPVWS